MRDAVSAILGNGDSSGADADAAKLQAKVLALAHFSVRVRRYGRTPERRPAALTANSARRTSCRLRA
jgi:hypothetical protein